MTAAPTWKELAERCERNDPHVGNAVARALGWTFDYSPGFGNHWRNPEGRIKARPPAYATSLDAIVALIEKEMPGQDWHVGVFQKRGQAMIMPHAAEGGVGKWIGAATPALALCAAFCRAMAAKTEKNCRDNV